MAEMSPRPGGSPGNAVDHRDLTPIYAAARFVLIWGFRIGAAILTAGLVLAIIKSESLNEKADSYSEVFPAIFDGKASGIVDLAILFLMATPVVTTLVVAVGFYRIGDKRFGMISLVVLAVLATSISLSLFR